MIIKTYTFLENDEVFKIEKECFSNENRSYKSLVDTSALDNFVGFVIEENGVIVGFITATYCLDESDIITVAVLPSYRKKGYATTLFNTLLKALKEKGVNKLFLEVREGNAKAISLYEKLGFTKISVRKNYYDGIENAICYRLDF